MNTAARVIKRTSSQNEKHASKNEWESPTTPLLINGSGKNAASEGLQAEQGIDTPTGMVAIRFGSMR